MDDQFGYHADFIQDVPDSLKCVVCHLVMRQPVQIMACGHRFCKSCFQRIQGYAEHLSTPLLCPLDRKKIDINKVFNDTAVSRDVSNLEVKCSNSFKGCTWTGRLGSLQNHDDACGLNQNQLAAEQPDSAFMMKTINEVTSRLSKLEEMFLTKEKEISCLTNNIQQLNTRCTRQEKEIQDLKKENAVLKMAITRNTDSIAKAEHQNISAVENHDLNETKFKQIREDITALKKNKPNNSDILKKMDEELKGLSLQLKRKVNENTHRNRIESLSTELKEQCAELGKQSDSLGERSKRLENCNERLKEQCEELDKRGKSLEKRSQRLEKCSERLEEQCEKLGKQSESLEEHILNIENLQFCSSLSSKMNEILFQWKVTDFQSHIDKYMQVRSPIFYTSVSGYNFQLGVDFSYKGYLGLYMRLHRCKTYDKPLEQYNIPYSWELLANNGSVESHKVDETYINNHKAWFEIPDGSESSEGWGVGFIHLNDISKYMLNDTITVQCRLHLGIEKKNILSYFFQ